jgi:very-short-patch-repair endonuclease
LPCQSSSIGEFYFKFKSMEKYPIILNTANSNLMLYPQEGIFEVSTNPLERQLAWHLSEQFGQKIFTHQKVGYYFPDISYIDEEKNILIDIEIDEPYTRSGIPTHFLDNTNDIQRNTFFTDNGWHVIRFSENQVKNELKNVIKTVDLFIKSLNNRTNKELNDFLNFFSEKRWSYSEAQKDLSNYKRDYYNLEAISIPQKPRLIVSEFLTMESLFETIIAKNFQNFNFRTDIIFIPYYISDHYINHYNSSNLIFLDCFTSEGKILVRNTLCHFPHFPDYPRIELINTNNLNSFEVCTEKKKNNLQVYVKNDYHDVYFNYDFFLFGTMKDYHESNLKLFNTI